MPHSGFVPLRVFSSYTMLEGAFEPDAIAERARELGFPAVALTDRNGLYAAMAFSKACRKAGVQPIIGTLLGVARPDRPEGAPFAIDWLALYAQDETGYANLCALVSKAHLDRPIEHDAHVDFDTLARHSDGVLALTAGAEGALARLFAGGQDAAAQGLADRLEAIFGDRLYVEISRRLDPVEGAAEAKLIELAYARGLPIVATNPCCYAEPGFHPAHDALLCIAHSSYVLEEDRPKSSPDLWLKPAKEMRIAFADLPEAIANTLVVAQRCAVAAPERKPILPSLAGDREGEGEMLRAQARAGLEMRLAKIAALESPSRLREGSGVGVAAGELLRGDDPPPNPLPQAGGGVGDAITRAAAAFPAWRERPLEARAAILERYADLLEANRTELMALCVHEAFKTIPDALGEIREAADFCRYYAYQARRLLAPVILPGPTGERNALHMEGRGVWATIAPWNFPLAIFTGQNMAALVAGNTVVAKPAPQTPRIAARAVALAHEAGVPADALILAPGGAETGAALVAGRRIAGVAFTGSTATARRIAQALLADENRPIVPLIAETGGINAMIVDSTALAEQVVIDVIASGFRSAGQRCSALRLLLLQEDIAAPVLEMIGGAMDLLRLGDPGDPATDIGPVIDQAAYDRLMAYRESRRAAWIRTVTAPKAGLFVPPTLIRIDSIAELDREWFGPLVHVATWPKGRLAETIDAVNAKGYGLTMGLHSRIARSAEIAEGRARVGNLYINRSMIGAVVGSQPFGGEGLSGTGPKAGGPNYLPRFCAERAVSVDTTSAGGNASLLSLDDAAG